MEFKIWTIVLALVEIMLLYIVGNLIDEYRKARKATVWLIARLLYDTLKSTMRINNTRLDIAISGTEVKITNGDLLVFRCVVKGSEKICVYTDQNKDKPLFKSKTVVEVVNSAKCFLR